MSAVKVYERLDDIPASYLKLFDRASRKSPFLGMPWFKNLAAGAFEPGNRVRIYGYETTIAGVEQPAAALLMRHTDATLAGREGRRLFSLSNYYSSLYEPITSGERESLEGLDAIARTIAAERPAWSIVEIMPMDPNTEEFSRLEDAFRGAGITVRFFCFGNWYLKVDAVNYDEYMRTRPSKLRVNVTRSRRKLQESGRLRLDIIRSHEGLEAAKAAYHSIYNSSWKKAEPFPLFIDGLLGVCADHGWLRLGVAYVDGEPAAAQIWLVIGDTASIFKMAYDERFIKLSIGTVLSSYLMEHVIDIDKVRTVDYLSGDDAYKRDWMSHRRERWGISVFNPLTLDGFAAAARHFGGRGFRRLAAVLPSRRTAGNQPVTALTEKNR